MVYRFQIGNKVLVVNHCFLVVCVCVFSHHAVQWLECAIDRAEYRGDFHLQRYWAVERGEQCVCVSVCT